MKNKKQNKKLNDLLFEQKFLFLQARKEEDDELWQIPTPVEKGTAHEESLKSEFDRYYTPENLEAAINHPSQVVNGVRDRMMQTVGGLGILNNRSILNERVAYRLQHFYQMAPEAYKHIIDEEVRRRGGPGTDSYFGISNFVYGESARTRIEREIAGQFFNFNPQTTNIGALMGTLSMQIRGLGRIGGPSFVDSRGRPINVGNQYATNEFDVATITPPGGVGPVFTPGNETVVVRWHQDDFITIKTKLERAGVWANFSRQGNARQYIHLKFRHSLLDQTIREEAGKLSADKYNPQRLTTWLENDLTAQALREDDNLRTWINGEFMNECNARGIRNATQLHEARNIDLLNRLKLEQNDARNRIRSNSLTEKLKKILKPLQLENVSTSKETKTMLAYLFYKLHTPKYAQSTREFIDELAGRDYDGMLKTADELIESSNNFIQNTSSNFGKIASINSSISIIQNQIAAKASTTPPNPNPGGIDEQLNKILQSIQTISNKTSPSRADAELLKELNTSRTALETQKAKLEEKIEEHNKNISELRKKIAEDIYSLGQKITNNRKNQILWGKNFDSLFSPAELLFINDSLCKFDLDDFLNSDEATQIRLLTDFQTQFNSHKKSILLIKKALNGQKPSIEKKKKGAEGKAKMDSRGLLYKLVERDLLEKGVTEQTGIQKKALVTTNLLVADCRNSEIFAKVNQKIAARLEKSGLMRASELSQTIRFFAPVISGKSALEHIVDTDPDLCMFKNITINSTRNDLLKILRRYGPIPPAKVREFIYKLAEVIRGIEVESKPGAYTRFLDWSLGRKKSELVKRVRVIDEDVPNLENIINLLTLLEAQQTAENFDNDVRNTEEFEPGTDRNKLYLKKLEEQTADHNAMDKSLVTALSGHNAEFKRNFDKAELESKYNEVMDRTEGLPREEQIAELEKEGLTERVISRGIISIKTKRRLKKGGWAALKYGPLSWPVWALLGVGKGAKWFGSYAKSILWTEESKHKAEKVKAMYKGAILEPAWKAVTWPVAIAGYAISRPKTWLKNIETRVMSGGGGHH